MSELPPIEALASVNRGVVYGLMSTYGASAQQATYMFAWQRDQALWDAVDKALTDAACGKEAPPTAAPRWLEGLVRRDLTDQSRMFHSGGRFPRVRLLERLGLVELEPDDTYVLAMVSALGPDKVDALEGDPELVDRALWRVFEVEGGGEVSLTNVDRFGCDDWRKTFLALTEDGTLDRARVLAGCLEALRRDFVAYRASWFSATYLALEPTIDELAAAQGTLRRLLGASVAATVSFSVRLLVRLQKAGRLEVEETLAALPPAALVKPKGTALDALRVAKLAGADHRAAVVEVARAALAHPHADVQRAAAELLETHGDAESVTTAANELSPSVRHDLGLDGEQPPGADARPRQQLAPVTEPVTAHDLAERTAALLEDASDAGELEAVLAALAEPGVEDRLAPLRKRARAVVKRGPDSHAGDSWLPGQVARLVLRLLDEATSPADPAEPAFRFLTRRCAELRQGSGPLLATPDLPGGWVSAPALVARLSANPAPRHHDLVAALLRLHPDGREDLAHDDLPPAVRFALDGEGRPRARWRGGRGGPQAWWVAAQRSRVPYGEEGPTLHSEIHENTRTENGRERRSRYVSFDLSMTPAHRAGEDRPTELKITRADGLTFRSPRFLADWIPFAASIWPHDAEHFLALTCLPVLESPNWTEVAHDVPRVLDALARHPGRLGPLAVITLAAGLSSADRDHRLHAVDAFLDLVPSGRIEEGELATALARFARAWPLNRWAESFRSASQVPAGALAVLSVLTALLPQLPTGTLGLSGLLEGLREETLRHGLPITDPQLRAWLSRHSGSSKAAKTARLLLS